MYEDRIESLGISIPEPPITTTAYVPAVKIDNIIYTSGQIPIEDGILQYKGKVGQDLSTEEGYEAAKLCCLNCLSVIAGHINSFDEIERIIKITGYVNSASKFTEQSRVINGASDLLSEIFIEAGEHARSVVGVSELPIDAAVEIEMVVQVKE